MTGETRRISWTYFRNTLILQIYQCWTPSASSQDHLVSVISSAIYCLNTIACDSIRGKQRLLESSRSIQFCVSKVRILKLAANCRWNITYLPNPKFTPWSFRKCPIALMALAAASQPPSPQNKPFHPWTHTFISPRPLKVVHRWNLPLPALL